MNTTSNVVYVGDLRGSYDGLAACVTTSKLQGYGRVPLCSLRTAATND